MAKKTDDPKVEPKPPALTVKDAPHAPILYFDGVSNFGHNGGVVTLTLGAARYLLDNGEIAHDVVAVGHLRCTIGAAHELREAIDSALLLTMPTGEKAN